MNIDYEQFCEAYLSFLFKNDNGKSPEQLFDDFSKALFKEELSKKEKLKELSDLRERVKLLEGELSISKIEENTFNYPNIIRFGSCYYNSVEDFSTKKCDNCVFIEGGSNCIKVHISNNCNIRPIRWDVIA